MFKVTILTDNIAHGECKAEWGFSAHIHYRGRNYLLDTGSSALFAKNAAAVGLRLNDVDAAILSHAHVDHSGGFAAFFQKNVRAQLYVSCNCAEDCYFKLGPIRKYVGVPRGLMAGNFERIVRVPDELYQIAEGVWLVPHVRNRLEDIGKRAHLYRRAGRKIVPDDFSHEQSLVFETEKGLIVLNSCSHGGLDNIARDVRHYLPGKKIYMTIGGLHLAGMRKDAVREIAGKIRALDIERVITGHCTGNKAYAVLREELGDRVTQTYTGMVIEV